MQSIIVRQLLYGCFVLIGALIIVTMLVSVLESRAYDADADADNYHPPPLGRPN